MLVIGMNWVFVVLLISGLVLVKVIWLDSSISELGGFFVCRLFVVLVRISCL